MAKTKTDKIKKEKTPVTKKEKESAITIVPDDNPVISVDSMIEMAIKGNAGVEALERLMDLKQKHEIYEAKKKYHRKFCEMQAEIPTVPKTKKVYTNSGKLAYSYASLDSIVETIKPFMTQFEFSYRWSEGLSENPGYKRVYCHIVGHGHQETSFADIPIMKGSKMTNDAQQAGSSSTYGRRYSLCGVLGLMVDEDDDGSAILPKDQTPPQNTNQQPPPYKPPPNVPPNVIPDPKLVKECQDLYALLAQKIPGETNEQTDAWISTIDLQGEQGIRQVIAKIKSHGISLNA